MLVIVIMGAVILPALDLTAHKQAAQINSWKVWKVNSLKPDITEQELENSGEWIQADALNPYPPGSTDPNKTNSLWIRLSLPADPSNTAVILRQLYGERVKIIYDNKVLYSGNHLSGRDTNNLLLPVKPEDGAGLQTLYIGVASNGDRLGLNENVLIGGFDSLLVIFVKKDLSDFILGSSFVFIAVIMLLCALFLTEGNFKSWLSLAIVILCIGVIIITYSPFLYNFYSRYEAFYYNLFDAALFIFVPVFIFYVEQIFDKEKYVILIRVCRIFQTIFSVICFGLLLLDHLTASSIGDLYDQVTGTLLGYVMIAQLLILVIYAVINALKGNREGLIFTIGFAIFAVTGITELILYYASGEDYRLVLWKWGTLCFVISLIIILGRRFARNHEQVVEYSRKLEMFNNELQRSEKMEIISVLAASVAHEVRNPLQVTRGFIQLLLEKEQQTQERVYLDLALEELDRASGIITDFLTFAKPEGSKIKKLNVSEEFRHIEGILKPMVHLVGGKIEVSIPESIHVMGSSSKFKQACVNMIKNSIESFRSVEGEIKVWAYELQDQVFIHIRDNGEGMTEEELGRLGEPYFSNKTKGTGLGLMVTFRIIEAMQGSIHFTSEKGKGTEAVLRFPSGKN
ncbi:sensor histidine kinase [Paenibacillus pinistramenti]|uniref:sensor histidine kinase n=1 Tax=Paenibacillus pinistramenti TaxID=1768003 RepID=UPI001EF03E13|nr:sensor histidine kinase [Paenibacillus pinistramenti]